MTKDSKKTYFAITQNKTNDYFQKHLKMDEHIAINYLNTIFNGKQVKCLWTTPKKLIEVLEANREKLTSVPLSRNLTSRL